MSSRLCAFINENCMPCIVGGGQSEATPLTPTEEAMATLISDVAVEGIPGIQETEDTQEAEPGPVQESQEFDLVEEGTVLYSLCFVLLYWCKYCTSTFGLFQHLLPDWRDS